MSDIQKTSVTPEIIGEIVDIKTAARVYLTTPKTLQKWIRKYGLPYMKIGNNIRINLPVFKKAMDEKFTIGSR